MRMNKIQFDVCQECLDGTRDFPCVTPGCAFFDSPDLHVLPENYRIIDQWEEHGIEMAYK